MHLATLNNFLSACGQLHPMVNVKNVIIALIDRLALFAQRNDSGGIPADIQLFDVFSEEIAAIINGREGMPPEDIVALQVSLINMAHKCYGGRKQYVDTVLEVTKKLFDNIGLDRVEYGTPVGREMEKLLKIPVTNYNNVLTVLSLPSFAPLLGIFDFEGRRAVSVFLAENAIDHSTLITTADEVDLSLTLAAPLVADQEDGPKADEWEDPDEFSEEQSLMGRLIHLFVSDDADQQYQILSTARKHFGMGGPRRIATSLPPIIIAAFKLAKRFYALKEQVREFTLFDIFLILLKGYFYVGRQVGEEGGQDLPVLPLDDRRPGQSRPGRAAPQDVPAGRTRAGQDHLRGAGDDGIRVHVAGVLALRGRDL